MELRRTMLVGVFVLMGLNVLIAFAAVGLLVRMSPAIDRILSENVYSLEAAEKMLEVLATPSEAEPKAREAAFREALGAAQANVTVALERPLLTRVEAEADAALRGDPAARLQVVQALRELTAINRAAMREVDEEAKRQGRAGAWFSVMVALVSLVVGALVARVLTRRIGEPLDQLYHVLESFRTGERHRRCTATRVPREFRLIFDATNRLLDEHPRGADPPAS